MSKIVKNQIQSVVTVADTGVDIPASGQYTINPTEYSTWSDSGDIVTLVGNGTLIINDGSVDLDKSNGINLIKGLFPSAFTLVGPQGDAGDIGSSGFGIYAFSNTTSLGIVTKGRGLTLNKTATGTYIYTFTTPTPDANYIVSAGFENLGTNTDSNWFVNDKTINGFKLTTGIGDNGQAVDVLTDMNHSVTIMGDAGPQGITSAYESWLDIGNVGTEQDFLDTIIGPQGIQGNIGSTGPQGATGPQGSTGPQGPTGSQGPQGLTGLTGSQGTQGIIGLTGSQGVQGDDGPTGPTGPIGNDGPIGPQGIPGPVSVFGSEYNYAEDLTQSQTTSNSAVSKLIMNINVTAGTYRVNWNYNWSQSSIGSDFRSEVTLDGVPISYHSQEPKDAGTDQQILSGGFKGNLILNGSHVIELFYWAEGNTSHISECKLELWRVL